MKKFVSLLLCLLLFLSVGLAESASPTSTVFDLENKTLSELNELNSQIVLAMCQTDEWESILVPQGVYEIGVDFPAGCWTVSAPDNAYTSVVVATQKTIIETKYQKYSFLDDSDVAGYWNYCIDHFVVVDKDYDGDVSDKWSPYDPCISYDLHLSPGTYLHVMDSGLIIRRCTDNTASSENSTEQQILPELENMSLEDLASLKKQVTVAMRSTDEWYEKTLSKGFYLVGTDLPAEHLTFSFYDTKTTELTWCIELDENEKNEAFPGWPSAVYESIIYIHEFAHPEKYQFYLYNRPSDWITSCDYHLFDGSYLILDDPIIYTPYCGKPEFIFY